jgi:hypothetical protein
MMTAPFAGTAALICGDKTAWAMVQRRAAPPDGLFRAKIDDFAQGESGRPAVPEARRSKLRA